MKKMFLLMFALFLMSGCVRQESIAIDESLTDKIYLSNDRGLFQDNTILDNKILTINYATELRDKGDLAKNKINPTVLKAYSITDETSNYLDNNPSSLCNEGKIEDCSSFLKGYTTGLIRSDQYLYFQTTIPESKFSEKEVFVRTDLDGSNMTEIYEIPIQKAREGSQNYVWFNGKVYYSFYDSDIFEYDENTNTSKSILKYDRDHNGFFGFESHENLTFRASSFKDDVSGEVFKNVLMSYGNGEFQVLKKDIDDFEVLLINDYFSLIKDELNADDNNLYVQFEEGKKDLLVDDFKYVLPGFYVLTDDYFFFTYVASNEESNMKTAMFKIEESGFSKIDEKEVEKDIYLNFVYKNIVVYGVEHRDEEFGMFIYPMYTTFDDKGFNDFHYIDEAKK